MGNKIKNLEDLFIKSRKLQVPSYQRAYSWNEEQLSQFVLDMLEMKNKGEYYYGHFILEKTGGVYEIIDGQQRLTTFILFLMVCRLFKTEGIDGYINKFETVDYDRKAFELIQNNIKNTNTDWNIKDFELTKDTTLSIQRILFALNYFRKLFNIEKSEVKLALKETEIDDYIKILTEAHISTHITCNKAVAVQIFELQNTRGIKLDLIEKVKAKLMKAIYLNAKSEQKDKIISDIQKNFSEIYRLEELVSSAAFRGDLSLEDILFHHLRVIDNGEKLSASEKNVFNSPSKSGNKEDVILSYINNRITEKTSPISVVEYITSLVDRFKISVEFVSEVLPELDAKNSLIGDVLILDKSLSLEFFILLYHKNYRTSIENNNVIRLWEKLLFTRDFHSMYHNLRYRDDFETLFFNIIKDGKVEDVIENCVSNGFRPDLMGNGKLPITVSQYIKDNESNILNNAFYWWADKMVYLLYKYEREQGADLERLRIIMKGGRSVEHILPQSWEWEWIGEMNENEISENGNRINKEVAEIINGIGNLLLITGSENSSLSNNHPMNKEYKCCSGGSYTEHNINKANWKIHEDWVYFIKVRGNTIYDFLKDFVN